MVLPNTYNDWQQLRQTQSRTARKTLVVVAYASRLRTINVLLHLVFTVSLQSHWIYSQICIRMVCPALRWGDLAALAVEDTTNTPLCKPFLGLFFGWEIRYELSGRECQTFVI